MCVRMGETVMPAKPAYKQHLSNAETLVTTYEQTRAGFVALALERNYRATPIIEEAQTLQTLATKAKQPKNLIGIASIQAALLTAAGVSDKAAGHFEDAHKRQAIQNLIENFLEPAGSRFVEELVFRFLLTKGDSLGGSMRNVGGALAHRKFVRGIIAALSVAGMEYQWLHGKSGKWLRQSDDDGDIDKHLRGIAWQRRKEWRTLVFNVTVPIVKNNIDICLLNCSASEYSPSILAIANAYITLGELKGGIDPAGADEHWKTARTALERIRTSFAMHGKHPYLFFIGAAIERKMSLEIWQMLEYKSLTNAANLTAPEQSSSLCSWLTQL
jgi:type II restriction enzyme